ncbi:MAG TPA: SDR family oxidoreductase [Frankiaceae bacterium]|nr:SDR family oxidoreductase [Frankiaceae bacterium]
MTEGIAVTYFVTGATGFIGRFLVERLLEREGEINVLVREGSRDRLDALIERWGAGDRVHAVVGDLGEERLGVSDDDVQRLTGNVDHFFHLAAVYDMTADDETNERLNVEGTKHAVDLANALQVGHLHHVSSVAAAGNYDGYFREDMFDEGQELPSPYHRTKFESEKVARKRSTVPWRIYRPAVVVGHSKTGEMDKIDGPYYFFTAIKRLRHLLPEWVPLAGPELGHTNIVPVDYVAAALDHIAHQPDLDGQAFHLIAPKATRSGEVLNTFAKAANAPQLSLRIDKRIIDSLPKGVLAMAMQIPAVKEIRKTILRDLGIPLEVIGHVALTPKFDSRDTERVLKGSGIEVPPLDSYADTLWDYWERNLDPDLFKDRSLAGAIRGKKVVITGGSSGIGYATALRVAEAGAVPILVARGMEKLEGAKKEIEEAGGEAHIYSVDLSSMDAIEEFVAQLLQDHDRIDMLVNSAGRSIRRGVMSSLDRFHDYERTMQLNYLGTIKMITGLLPHWKDNGGGHVVNVSSIGAQTYPPRFSAYIASKAALDGWTACASSEVVGYNITFTTVHMQLVKTPMIAPTKIYDAFPTITPEEAADIICEGLRTRPKELNTRIGTAGEVLHALMPKAMDQILHMAYRVFPESSSAKKGSSDSAAGDESSSGEGDSGSGDNGTDGKASNEAFALAHLLKGVHW